ncbi:MAG TPA: adenylate/guanylate cyclase domain-containing protein, partial [Stenomitos sp.]
MPAEGHHVLNCAHCLATLPTNAKFCTQCGTRAGIACPSCQTLCTPTSKFCTQCGTRVATEAPASRQPANANAGDRRVVTVLFTDVSGFTAMSEKLDPERVTEIVNQFFEVLTEPIYRYGGVVDKYIGDAIMALFGAPIAHEDDPERATHAAFEMQRAAKVFADQLEARTGIALRVRIGINTGLVVAGAVGGEQKRDYTVMGDTVNMAQRMESAAQPGRVLVTLETYRLTSKSFEFKELAPLEIKGKSQPVKIYELVGPRSSSQETAREKAIFVNRRRELDSLALSWNRACEGMPQLIVVNGEAGIGKSRLVAHFVQNHCTPAPLTLRARCQSYTSTASFGLVTGIITYWLDLAPNAPSQEVRQRLADRCMAAMPAEGARHADLIGGFLGLEPTDPELASLSQEQRRNAALNALNATLTALGTKSPLLLSLEDLQWADEASMEWFKSFLDHVSQYAEPIRLLVLCQHRPEANPIPSDHWKQDLTVVQLRPMELLDCLDVVASILKTPAEALSGDSELAVLIQQVLERSSGNPFYLHELITSLIDSKMLLPGTDGWTLATAGADIKLPSTIHGAVAARLDRLNRDLKGLLQVGALLGRTFSLAMIEQVCLRANDNLESLLELCRLGFLYRNSQGDFAFTQPLIQEVAYQSLLMSSRKEIHGRTGRALEALYADHLEENAHLLAHHYLLAEQNAPALKFLYLSGQRAFDFYDLSRARTDLERAREVMKSLPEQPAPAKWQVMWLLGQVLTLLGQFDGAFEALSAGHELATTNESKASVLRTKGDAHERKGEFEAALECYQEGLHLFPEEDKLSRAPLIAKMGYVKYRLGQHDDCVRLSTEALDLMDGTVMAKEQGLAHSYLGISYNRRGDVERAIHHTRLSLQYREACKDLGGIAACYNSLANIHSNRGEYQEADEYYHRSLVAYERIGDPYFISLVHNNHGTLLLNRGELTEAEEHFRKALDSKQRIGDRLGVGIVLFNIGEVRSRRGMPQDALASMQKALEIFHELDSKEVYPEVYMTIGRVWTEAKQPAEARKFLTDADRYAVEVGDDATKALIPRILSEVHVLEGDLAEARKAAERAIELVSALDMPLDLGRAYAQLAEVLRI